MELALPVFKPLSKLISIESEPLITLQIIPHFNITNGRKIENIIDGLHSLYKPFNERISFKNNQIIIQTKEHFYYAILLTHDQISFYYTIPQHYKDWFIQRVYSSWTNQVTIIPKDDYIDLFNIDMTIEWQLKPKYKPYKAFISDYRQNAPIPSILSGCKDLQPSDKVLFEFCFTPIHESLWKEKTEEQQIKYRYGTLTESDANGVIGIIMDKLFNLVDGCLSFLDLLLEVDKPKRHYNRGRHNYFDDDYEDYWPRNNNRRKVVNDLSSASRQKINYNGFNGQIRILSQSIDSTRQEMAGKTIIVALKDLMEDGGNEFGVYKKINKLKTINRPTIKFYYLNNHVFSSKEIGQFLQLPEKKWQEEYPVEKVEVQEINIPKVLLKGGIQIGTAKYKGQTQTVYWNNTDQDVACLPKCWFGYQGSGKTKALTRYAVESVEHKRGLFVLDGIQNCQLSDEIRDYLPKDFPEEKIIELNFADLSHIIPLSWNEINIDKLTNENDRLKFSNNLAQELIKFLDSLVEDTSQKLSPRMRRYLSSAALLTFSIPNTTIMDILLCLTEYEKRHELINRSKLDRNNKIIKDLLELDDNNGDTRMNLIQGIIDRLDLLLGDYILNNLFSTQGCDKIDFTKWIKGNYVVFCKMPQDELNDSTIKTLTTFLISKIWFAKLMLGNKVNHTTVICDEAHRTSLKFENIREMRKFGLEYIFSAHQPSDFKHILNTLKSAGCSFVLLNTTKDNIKHFESEIRPYTIEEVLDLKKYHGLGIINYDKTFKAFMFKLPELLPKERYVDRSHLTKICSEKYGIGEK